MVKYICWSKDEENLKRATSGGVMYEFAKFVINELNGHVVGVDKDGNWDIVSTLKEVEKFQGSKYYEGNPSSWKTMYNKLKYKRNTIMFVGKPCDVTLLKTVTDKKNILICKVTSSFYEHKVLVRFLLSYSFYKLCCN